MPHDLAGRSDALRESVSKKLQTTFTVFCLWVSKEHPELFAETGLASHLEICADNSSLLQLEENLVHEFAHEVLDNVMELDPLIVKEEPERMFKLTWSGKLMTFYGYFHAFFIYIALANYYSRIKTRSMREQRRVMERISHILGGLVRAIPELEAANLFTPKGKQLFENLKAEVVRLKENQPHQESHPSNADLHAAVSDNQRPAIR